MQICEGDWSVNLMMFWGCNYKLQFFQISRVLCVWPSYKSNISVAMWNFEREAANQLGGRVL